MALTLIPKIPQPNYHDDEKDDDDVRYVWESYLIGEIAGVVGDDRRLGERGFVVAGWQIPRKKNKVDLKVIRIACVANKTQNFIRANDIITRVKLKSLRPVSPVV